MLNRELQHFQDALDEEMGVCPDCGKPTKWGDLRIWESCDKCFNKWIEKENREMEEKDKKDFEETEKANHQILRDVDPKDIPKCVKNNSATC